MFRVKADCRIVSKLRQCTRRGPESCHRFCHQVIANATSMIGRIHLEPGQTAATAPLAAISPGDEFGYPAVNTSNHRCVQVLELLAAC